MGSLFFVGLPTPGLEHLGLPALATKTLDVDSGPKIRLLTPTLGLIVLHTDCVLKGDFGEIQNYSNKTCIIVYEQQLASWRDSEDTFEIARSAGKKCTPAVTVQSLYNQAVICAWSRSLPGLQVRETPDSRLHTPGKGR